MNADLPEKFEYVVIGTGVAESLVAAALSRNGKTVLHIDKNDHYGNLWATFGFNDLTTWLTDTRSLVPPEPERSNGLKETIATLSPEWEWGDTAGRETEDESATNDNSDEKWTEQKIRRLDRHFNIDLMPKFIYARGATVENLVESDAGRYLEFHPIRRLVAIRPDGLIIRVPANRYEMFKTKHLEPKQKWQISSFLQWCVGAADNDEQIIEYENRPLRDMLSEKKNMDRLCQEIVINTMTMASMDVGTREGIERLKRMLSSLHRYGPYPFLWPLYGSGELPQAYCRFSAVFGGIYCLGRSVDEIICDDDGRCSKLTLNTGQTITLEKDLVVHSGYLSSDWVDLSTKKESVIARGVFLTTKQFFQSDAEEPEASGSDGARRPDEREITILSYPLPTCADPALVIELPPEAKVCPKGTYLVHMTAKLSAEVAGTSPRTIFEPLVQRLFSSPGEGEAARPVVLWSAYFCLPDFPNATSKDCPPNLHVVTGPDASFDFDVAIHEARSLFERLCPGEPFMPRAPSVDEILIVDGEASLANPAAGESDEEAEPPPENVSGDK